jgi:hypothetical protein
LKLKLAALSILAATAMLPSNAVASEYQSCSGVTLYSADDDPAGLNIRSGPSTQHAVLGKTEHRQLFMTAFNVIGSQDGWFKVKAIGEWDYKLQGMKPLQSFGGIGWVSGKKLNVTYYAGETIFLHKTAASKKVKKISVELEISGPQRLIGCKGQWVLIEHDEITEMADDPKDEKSTVYLGWVDGQCNHGKRCPFVPTGGPWVAPPWTGTSAR